MKYPDIEDFPDGRSASEYADDYQRLLAAAQDGEPPFDDELEAAPLIVDWSLHPLKDPETQAALGYPPFQLWGYFQDHPFLPAGELAHSSPVLQIDPAGKWARCASRVYRLGRPKLAVFGS